jgi:uroporphyrinogen-III synthase
MPDVVLLRSDDDNSPDRYVQALTERGLDAVCEPVLEFRYPRQDVLHLRLSQRDQYGGLIATSPRALEAVAEVFEEDDEVQAKWTMARTYVVGPRTAEKARTLGLHPNGEEAGNAEELVAAIEADGPSKPLLFLCGDKRRDVLPDGLFDAGVKYNELEVYSSSTRGNLSLPDDATWLAFFSPSGLQAVESSGIDPTPYRLAAIGDTTARALEDAGYPVSAIADEPSPESLADAIAKVDRG